VDVPLTEGLGLAAEDALIDFSLICVVKAFAIFGV
jgi:hypothetical protein